MFASAIEFYDQLICLQKNTRHRGHKRQNIHRSGLRERRTERQRQGHGERRGRERETRREKEREREREREYVGVCKRAFFP